MFFSRLYKKIILYEKIILCEKVFLCEKNTLYEKIRPFPCKILCLKKTG